MMHKKRREDEDHYRSAERYKVCQDVRLGGSILGKIVRGRREELALLKSYLYTAALNLFLWMAPMLMTTATFGVYIYLGYDMTAKTAFTLISTLFIIQRAHQIPFIYNYPYS